MSKLKNKFITIMLCTIMLVVYNVCLIEETNATTDTKPSVMVEHIECNTTLTDKEYTIKLKWMNNATKTPLLVSGAEINETFTYKTSEQRNPEANKEYTINAVLIDKNTGKPILVNEKEVHSKVKLKLNGPSKVTVTQGDGSTEVVKIKQIKPLSRILYDDEFNFLPIILFCLLIGILAENKFCNNNLRNNGS